MKREIRQRKQFDRNYKNSTRKRKVKSKMGQWGYSNYYNTIIRKLNKLIRSGATITIKQKNIVIVIVYPFYYCLFLNIDIFPRRFWTLDSLSAICLHKNRNIVLFSTQSNTYHAHFPTKASFNQKDIHPFFCKNLGP